MCVCIFVYVDSGPLIKRIKKCTIESNSILYQQKAKHFVILTCIKNFFLYVKFLSTTHTSLSPSPTKTQKKNKERKQERKRQPVVSLSLHFYCTRQDVKTLKEIHL